MNARYTRQITGTDEEFFRCHPGRHGAGRSLSALWQLFHGAAATVVAVPAEPFLQHPEGNHHTFPYPLKTTM